MDTTLLGAVGYPGHALRTPTIRVTIGDAAMRTLNSVPVTLVAAPGAQKLIVPRRILWVAQTPTLTSFDQEFLLIWGDVANSNPIALSLGTLNGNNEPAPVFDSAIQWLGPAGAAVTALPIFDTGNPADCLNKPIKLSAVQDVTGGDGMTWTGFVTYDHYDLTGLF